MGRLINFNGELVDASLPLIHSDDRSFRFGDGLFETMRIINGIVKLNHFHFERLFSGLNKLAFDIPSDWTPSFFQQQILALASDNHSDPSARVRLTISRGRGALSDVNSTPLYIIETFPVDEGGYPYNTEGVALGLFTDAKKSCDEFSNLKSNNYLQHVMAVKHAARYKIDECILLNSYDRICETTISNLFLIKEQTIFTVPLSEGPVQGVMRRLLIEQLPSIGYELIEQPIEIGDLNDADEIFLTNAVSGIRWVSRCDDRVYSNQHSFHIYTKLLASP